MPESSKNLPDFESVDALTEFFDRNDMGDFFEAMPEVEFEVDLKRRMHYVALDAEIAGKLSEISRHEHVSSGAIVNSWLREKISDYSSKHQ